MTIFRKTYILDVPDEIQGLVGLLCDPSSRMCFYLTCRALYFTPNPQIRPSRPHMLWRSFALSAVEFGHVALIRFGLDELQMDPFLFRRHLELAALNGHREVFKIKELGSIRT